MHHWWWLMFLLTNQVPLKPSWNPTFLSTLDLSYIVVFFTIFIEQKSASILFQITVSCQYSAWYFSPSLKPEGARLTIEHKIMQVTIPHRDYESNLKRHPIPLSHSQQPYQLIWIVMLKWLAPQCDLQQVVIWVVCDTHEKLTWTHVV